MHRLSWIALVLLLIAAAAFIVTTSAQLPDRVASHFGSGGRANGWMSREFYTWFMLGFGVLLPLVLAGFVALLAPVVSRSVDLSSRARRSHATKRDAAIAASAGHAPWLGVLIAAFIAGLHYAILDANAATPPHLSGELFTTLMIAFLGAIAAWVATLAVRARRAL